MEHVPFGKVEYSLRVELVVVTELVEGVLMAVGLLVLPPQV